MMRVTRTLGNSNEQGRLFGFLEGGRGLCTTIVSLALVPVLGAFASQVAGLRSIIIIISVLNLLVGVLAWFVLPGEVVVEEGEQKFHFKDMGKVFKNPAVWLIAVVILCCYSVYLGTTYLTPYLTEVCGITAAASAIIAIFRTYVNQLVGGPIGGIIADKITITKTIIVTFIIIVIGVLLFAFLPAGTAIGVLVTIMIIFVFAIFMMRGIYFATLDEVDIPMTISGTAIGVISFIGFFPDVYMNVIAGMMLDAAPGAAGYQHLFILMAVFAVIGTLAAFALNSYVRKHKVRKSATASRTDLV
jgi:predicted MFS family arabinose efflux permease